MAYQLSDPSRLISTSDPVFTQSPEAAMKDTDDLVQPVTRKGQFFVLPSVAERIQGLYRAIPIGHPSFELVRQLHLNLQQQQEQQQQQQQQLMQVTRNSESLSENLKCLSSITQAHRLHDTILKLSTTHCHPRTTVRAFPRNRNEPDHQMTVTLETYIGDVLIAYYLMGHSLAEIVEGPTTHEHWLKSIDNFENYSCRENDPLRWYRHWVVIHSTILRTLPLKKYLLGQYKITPICGIQGRCLPDNIEWIQPHYPFSGGCNPLLYAWGRSLLPAEPPLTFDPRQFYHTTTLRNFGPLGPAFRGRDSVRSVSVGSHVINYLQEPDYQPLETWEMENYECYVVRVASRVRHQKFWDWISELPRECYMNRPMTVEPPLVTIHYVGIGQIGEDQRREEAADFAAIVRERQRRELGL